METLSDQILKFSQMFKEILLSIEYSDQEADSYLVKFLALSEAKVLERLDNRLPNEVRGEFQQAVNSFDLKSAEPSKLIQEYIKHYFTPKDVGIIYSEVLGELFNSWLQTVAPTMNEDQKNAALRIIEDFSKGIDVSSRNNNSDSTTQPVGDIS